LIPIDLVVSVLANITTDAAIGQRHISFEHHLDAMTRAVAR
jgi:hypothetical protein